ncbi:hypothetical protein H5410_036866, partial [Solanum commersonii]
MLSFWPERPFGEVSRASTTQLAIHHFLYSIIGLHLPFVLQSRLAIRRLPISVAKSVLHQVWHTRTLCELKSHSAVRWVVFAISRIAFLHFFSLFAPFCPVVSLPCSLAFKTINRFNKKVYKYCCLRLNINAHKKGSNYIYNYQLCTQSFKLRLIIVKCNQAHNACFKCKFKLNKGLEITYNSHTQKDEHLHDSTHRLALIFQSTFVLAHARSQ